MPQNRPLAQCIGLKILKIFNKNKRLTDTEAYTFCVVRHERMMNMKKNILKVHSASVMFNVWFLVILPILIWLLFFAVIGTENDSLLAIIQLSSILLLFSVFFIIHALYMTQRAEISEQGIKIYSIIFSTIKVIKWNELIDVRTENIVTFTSANGGYRSKADWIVLYTNLSQKEKEHKLFNRKKTGPWYISCTKENETILTEYIIKYAPHISDDPDVFF